MYRRLSTIVAVVAILGGLSTTAVAAYAGHSL